MMDDKHLADHLRNRPTELREAKAKGTKIIGYFPGNYVPEEIIYAAGAVPLCLNSGGNPQPANVALSVVPSIICPFARTQIGERLLKENQYYSMIDMLVAPITCQHIKKATDIWEYYYDELEIFKLGIPHRYSYDFEVEYYTNRLRMLKDRLQAFTGNEITDEKLGSAVELYNRMRKLLREISLLRRASPVPISALDFIRLNHASFYADPAFMVDFLESVYHELRQKSQAIRDSAPRLLLIGPSIGDSDYKILDMASDAGGTIVIEEVCEGIRYYWHEIANKGDLFQSLTKGYLVNKLPCAFMANSTKKRFDFALELIKDFNVSGVIWYELLCCETYDSESYYFTKKLEERNIPMLVLEADYGTSDIGRFKVRLEALVEILKGGMEL
jgi:benzoyl-CoA reductase/2-hydroxyglutaryl-CoA dehydratase subunit BcrC/BadD/HgdB